MLQKYVHFGRHTTSNITNLAHRIRRIHEYATGGTIKSQNSITEMATKIYKEDPLGRCIKASPRDIMYTIGVC